MVGHSCNPATQEVEAGGCLPFQASLVYTISSRPVRATRCDPVLVNKHVPKYQERSKKMSEAEYKIVIFDVLRLKRL